MTGFIKKHGALERERKLSILSLACHPRRLFEHELSFLTGRYTCDAEVEGKSYIFCGINYGLKSGLPCIDRRLDWSIDLSCHLSHTASLRVELTRWHPPVSNEPLFRKFTF